jgi:hypothetical protein
MKDWGHVTLAHCHNSSSTKGDDVEINYCSARCGAGKTIYALNLMTSQEWRWLYVVDRRDVIDDRIEALEIAARRNSTSPFIRAIHTPPIRCRRTRFAKRQA